MGAIFLFLTVTLFMGCLLNFWGKKLYFAVIMCSAFGASMLLFIQQFGTSAKGLLLGVIVGILLAFVSRFIYKFGVFLLGAFGGFIISALLCTMLPATASDYKWVFILAGALIIAICAVIWCELFIIFSTAACGASMIASALTFLVLNIANLPQFIYADGAFSTMSHLANYLQGDFAVQNSVLLTIVTTVLFVIGFCYQNRELSVSRSRQKT